MIHGHVVDVVDEDLHGRPASEGGVRSTVVVLLEPGTQGEEALLVGAIHARVRPLVEQRPVEAFRLAVGLRPEGPCRQMPSAELVEGSREGARPRVVLGVVGHDPLDAHPEPGEEGRRLAQERSTRRAPLVGVADGIGDPAHVVDDLVDVVVAAMGPWRAVASPPEAVATAVGDTPQLLDVHVEQLPGVLADVADGDARGSVPIGQAREAMAAQDIADGRAREVQGRGQAVGPHTELVAVDEDGLERLLGQAPGRAVRPAGALLEAVGSELPVAAHPLRGRLSADPRGCGGVGDRPALDLDAIDQQLPTEDRQLRPTMCHESLPSGVSWIPTPNLEGLSFVNNVLVNHS